MFFKRFCFGFDWKGEKNFHKKNKKHLPENKKGFIFAPAKGGKAFVEDRKGVH